ncbi:MAG: YbaK/EbsC family protein [Candidatus Thiodiazotropha sp.]
MTAYNQALCEARKYGIECSGPLKESIHVVQSLGIWARFSLNRNGNEVESCIDAARNRYRLGTYGIPLWDELKTNVFRINRMHKQRFVAAHCRGDKEIDKELLRNTRGADHIERISSDLLQKKFEAQKGTVTPFRWSIVHKCDHIFDQDVFDGCQPGSTMMTNAGDKRWGIEFNPHELVQGLDQLGRVGIGNNILLMKKPFSSGKGGRHGQRRIGIVTGNAPESGMLLWQKINRVARRELKDRGLNAGDVGLPAVLLNSVPAMGVSMELDLRKNQARSIVVDAMKSLCLAGCEILALACNTTQCFSKEIINACGRWDATFLSMPEALMAALSRDKCDRARFLGLSFVADFDGLSAYSRLRPEVELFSFEKEDEKMIDIAYKVKQGKTQAAMQKLNRILEQEDPPKIRVRRGKMPVVMALTELSIAIDPLQKKHESMAAKNVDRPPLQMKDRVVYDTLGIYAEAIVHHWLNPEITNPHFSQ